MHVGKEDQNCPTLEVHNKIVDQVMDESYLRDVITSDAKHTVNIKKRKSRCIGSVVDITSLLKQLCLGQFHFYIAVLLRESILLSSLLLNSEVWLRFKKI